MNGLYPGTVVEKNGRSAEEFLEGIFAVTRGVTLGQVREITGLETPAIQNWTSRGWVQRPIEKRYGIDHVARIIIISMLRDSTKLENIAAILRFINGEAGNKDDDIIPESRLYRYVCMILDTIDFDVVLSQSELYKAVYDATEDYEEPYKGARERLVTGIELILTYYAASLMKKRGDAIFESCVQKS